jgi:1,4-dihydroxy-2-naphthoate octaprenyltransferase
MNAWILALRPKTLPASISPILVANALGWNTDYNWLVAVLTMLTALTLQIAVNFANDYFDFKSGVDTAERLGPQRATQSGLILPQHMRMATFGTLGLAIVWAVGLMIEGGLPIILLALASTIAVLWYSGGPWPLASLGLGEIVVFLFFGWAAVLGTEFLHTEQLSLSGWWLGTQLGLISAAIMLVNNIRDHNTDSQAGKRTLAVRIGLTRSHSLYRFLLITPFFMQALAFIVTGSSVAAVLPFLTAPIMIRLIRQMGERQGEALNSQLAETARLLALFSLTLTIGIIIGS